MGEEPRVGSDGPNDEHELNAPEITARLESVGHMAFDYVIRAGRDSDAADNAKAKAMRETAKRLLMNRGFLADPADRKRYAKKIALSLYANDWNAADVRQRGEAWARNDLEENRSSYFDPGAVFDREEIKWQKRQATKAINVLSPRRRELMIGHHIKDLPTKALADASGRTDGSVRVTIHNALVAVRERLGQTKRAKNRRGKKP